MMDDSVTPREEFKPHSSPLVSMAPQEVMDKAQLVVDNLYKKMHPLGLKPNDAFFITAAFIGFVAPDKFSDFTDQMLEAYQEALKQPNVKPDDTVTFDSEKN